MTFLDALKSYRLGDPAVKLDLGDLERVARRRAVARVTAAPDPEWFEACAAYLDATAEPVTLALIARIRELEAVAFEASVMADDRGLYDSRDRFQAIAERGVVLP